MTSSKSLTSIKHESFKPPMLAQTLDKSKVVFPVMMQPKLDGVRCLVHFLEDGSFVALSRNGLPLTLPDHIIEAIEGLQKDYKRGLNGCVLDGEVYMHGMSFQEIASRLKRLSTRHPDSDTLQYWIYDIIFPQENLGVQSKTKFADRHATVENILTAELGAIGYGVVCCPTLKVHNEHGLEAYHLECTSKGFEGSMVRDPKSVYASGKRSWGLVKYKNWLDEEFTIIKVDEGEGKNAGTAVLTCAHRSCDPFGVPEGKYFTVTAPGDYAEKAKWWTNRAHLVGAKLTVKYQNLTDDGIPRFPIAIGIKEDR